MIIWKISKQAKFQLKHNRKDFISSVRITVVIGFQTVIYGFGFFIEAYDNFLFVLINNSKLKIRTTRWNNAVGQDYNGYLDLRIAEWFDGTYGLSSDIPRQMIVQFRILIEAFVVLGIMTGYREALIDFVKIVFDFLRHPLKTFKRFKQNLNSSKISVTTVF
uniref:Uncharacterized protein n=1 Tax=Panagrolaimus davidi TaxID=227884 RepID=A0A914PDH0_9BILA